MRSRFIFFVLWCWHFFFKNFIKMCIEKQKLRATTTHFYHFDWSQKKLSKTSKTRSLRNARTTTKYFDDQLRQNKKYNVTASYIIGFFSASAASRTLLLLYKLHKTQLCFYNFWKRKWKDLPIRADAQVQSKRSSFVMKEKDWLSRKRIHVSQNVDSCLELACSFFDVLRQGTLCNGDLCCMGWNKVKLRQVWPWRPFRWKLHQFKKNSWGWSGLFSSSALIGRTDSWSRCQRHSPFPATMLST